ARVGRARVLLAHACPEEALEQTREIVSLASPGMNGEYVGTRAVALACLERVSESMAAADEAERTSRSFEARSTAACARAILALHGRDERAVESAHEQLAVIASAGHVDGLVMTYRSFPRLLTVGMQNTALEPMLAQAVRA